jgi:hypothetical protein
MNCELWVSARVLTTFKQGFLAVSFRQAVKVRFQILKAANIKMTVSWNVAPCILIEIDRRFKVLVMETISASETSVIFSRLHGKTTQKTDVSKMLKMFREPTDCFSCVSPKHFLFFVTVTLLRGCYLPYGAR